jgi:hypothetical protein
MGAIQRRRAERGPGQSRATIPASNNSAVGAKPTESTSLKTQRPSGLTFTRFPAVTRLPGATLTDVTYKRAGPSWREMPIQGNAIKEARELREKLLNEMHAEEAAKELPEQPAQQRGPTYARKEHTTEPELLNAYGVPCEALNAASSSSKKLLPEQAR